MEFQENTASQAMSATETEPDPSRSIPGVLRRKHTCVMHIETTSCLRHEHGCGYEESRVGFNRTGEGLSPAFFSGILLLRFLRNDF